MDFYCRDRELAKMNQRYDSGRFEFVVIYGRRRVGKTALINKFCEGKRTILLPALNSTARENLTALSRSLALFRDPEMEAFPEYSSFEDAFAEITRIGREEQVIFVIDEYPYLAKADPSISSRLQHLIDHQWQESRIYLILCGSSMSFMQEQVLGYESPLYGRRTAQFKIDPLTYRETAVFNRDLSAGENACVYGITGGIPHYINKLSVHGDLDRALTGNFFDTSSYLFEEPGNLLKQELREPAVYNSIITAIAGGASRLHEIAAKAGIETSLASKYLSVLIELGIIQRETPFMEKPGKKTIYMIDDEFFRFWYRFVPRNMPLIASDRMGSAFASLIKPKLHDYMGPVFEKMCRQFLINYASGLPFFISDAGQWWGTDPGTKSEVRIDIVASPVTDSEKAPKEYIIGSCKFRNEKVGPAELELLKRYAAVFGKGERYYYYIFSLSGFTEALLKAAEEENVRLITLADMYR